MTNWTIERADKGAPGRRAARGFTGMTLLMSTEELLELLDDGVGKIPDPAPAPQPGSKPERRLRLVPPPDAGGGPTARALPTPALRTIWAPTPAPVPQPGLRRRLQCARRGHDPRPHRPLPHDAVVYRCLRCGAPMPAPPRA